MIGSKFKKLLQSHTGKVIISVILGLGLATLFRKICNDDDSNCIVYKGKDNKEIKGKTFKFNNKCYQYDVVGVSCDDKKNIISY